MRSVWKFPLVVEDEQVVRMPAGAELLCVQVQRDIPCLWALVDPDAPLAPVALQTYGTGHPIAADPGDYIGTYQLHGGALVFHVFCGGTT